MRVEVLLSSGEVDGWNNVKDAIIQEGGLIVVRDIPGDEVPGDMKTVELRREVDQGPDLPPMEKTDTLEVQATYAPGMWMRVTYGIRTAAGEGYR